jgi:hypothetical protein
MSYAACVDATFNRASIASQGFATEIRFFSIFLRAASNAAEMRAVRHSYFMLADDIKRPLVYQTFR